MIDPLGVQLEPRIVGDVGDEDVHIIPRSLELTASLLPKLVDATDFDSTCIAGTLAGILNSPVILGVNKVDLLPRFDAADLDFVRRRTMERGLRCAHAHAVSAVCVHKPRHADVDSYPTHP